jgi:hypothetical protein
MTRLIPILAFIAIGGAVIAQTPAGQPAQPGRAGQSTQPGASTQPGMAAGGMQQTRDAQMKALTALQDDITRLRANVEASMPANMQNMTEQERSKMTAARDEQQKLVQDMESQLAMLKGRRQVQTEHDQTIAQLQAIQNQAKQENATKTADMIGKMIQEKQAKHDQLMMKLGGLYGMGGRTQP